MYLLSICLNLRNKEQHTSIRSRHEHKEKMGHVLVAEFHVAHVTEDVLHAGHGVIHQLETDDTS